MNEIHLVRSVRLSVVAEGRGKRYAGGIPLDAPAKVLPLLKKFIPDDDKERLATIMLDVNHRPIGINIVSVGTLTASLVHPREVLRPLVVLGAAAFIMAHNHPSGEPTPSSEDKATTKRVTEAARIIGIPMLDHIVFVHGSEQYTSFRQLGLLT